MQLTKSELEIMNLLWRENRPLSRGQILELSGDKSWKDNSVHILLNGMLKKEAIHEEGFVRSGKVWGRLYAPSVDIGSYYFENIFLPLGQDCYPMLFSAMLKDPAITEEILDQFDVMLRERRARMK